MEIDESACPSISPTFGSVPDLEINHLQPELHQSTKRVANLIILKISCCVTRDLVSGHLIL
jgi:hypothetical protein